MAQELSGILVALITPFTTDKQCIDWEALDAHINRMISAGLHGLVPGGSTGEFAVLSISDRKQLVERCVSAAAGRVPVVAGIGDVNPGVTIELGVHAAQAGAAAVMVVPPFYDPLSFTQLKEFLSEVHQACKLPIMYYNIPSASGANLSPAELGQLSAVGVKYMKDTSGNGPALTEMLFHRDNEITCFNGWDTLTFYGLAAGAKGSVWGASNIIPELSAELWEAVAVRGDLKKGRELWRKIWPICNALEQGNYAANVKTGMELRGWSTGGTRKPFHAALSEDDRSSLRELLKQVGVI